jgi:hypothetical protein
MLSSKKNFMRLHDFPLLRARILEYFSKDWCVAGIVDFVIDGISDVIEKCIGTGVVVVLGGMFGSLGDLGQKG